MRCLLLLQVPVGEDQRQHLELTRDISRRFNDQFGRRGKGRVFREPAALIVKEGARVMSLIDGTSKMSKSAENDNSRINLLDSIDSIAKKVSASLPPSLSTFLSFFLSISLSLSTYLNPSLPLPDQAMQDGRVHRSGVGQPRAPGGL